MCGKSKGAGALQGFIQAKDFEGLAKDLLGNSTSGSPSTDSLPLFQWHHQVLPPVPTPLQLFCYFPHFAFVLINPHMA